MLEKFLKEIVVMVVGKQAEEIVDLLNNKKHTNEFIIAKKLDMTINQTRNILYKLSDHGLVSSIRKKDKKKGWYTYFWKIEILKSLQFLREILIKRIDQIDHQIKSRETKQFYVCERCNIEFNEENALLYDFTCNECGNVFSIKDNSKMLRELKKNLDKIKNDLEFIDEEIKNEKEWIDKKKLRELKKLEKEKPKKRITKSKKIPKKKISKTPKIKRKKIKPVIKFLKKKQIRKKSIKKKSIKKKIKPKRKAK